MYPVPFLEDKFQYVVTSTSMSSTCPLSVSLPNKTPYVTLFSLIRATCSAHLIFLALTTRVIFGKGYNSCNCSSCQFQQYPLNSSLLAQNIVLRSQFSKIIFPQSSLNVRDQASQKHKHTFLFMEL
jgi:hypothetical protein